MMSGLIKNLRDPAWLWNEFWRMFRYGIVGLVSTGIFMGLYAILSRFIWPSANKTLLDAIALSICAVFNYTLHRIWTFNAGTHSTRMISRYVSIIVLSSMLQTALFHLGNGVLGFNDFVVQIVLVPFIAAIQYVVNRQFTFNRRFEKTCPIVSESTPEVAPVVVSIVAPDQDQAV
jgi:putative flippase GtrA